ncbi:MAG: bifunctional adenosylcobinamide kinase/adenosylcobinamide-phosphate guanylyltransferase [Vallitaleaceae bacterium]|nr:bifunctional adenosylcobinamide kinase/adenosylcobinamide-phosphate guanylyltransferase [Vallitaleaceae bacterium]
MMILVSGGARSGKSKRGEELLQSIEGKKAYIATAIPFDEEMKARILKHQERRGEQWDTLEAYMDLEQQLDFEDYQGILLDCVTLWISNLFFYYLGDRDIDCMDQDEIQEVEDLIMEQVERFIVRVSNYSGKLVLVTNEIGMGIVPEHRMSRVFRDIQGRVNQKLGSVCQQLELVVCGVRIKVK